MSEEMPKQKRVFISYSWTTPDYEMRVLSWAERLRGDGVDVVLDKWDLHEGQDKYVFMEQMIVNPEMTKVVVFSDAAYAQKADQRKGGVGTESQIISKEIYDKVGQQKFIPVVCDYSADGKPCLPVFLAGRIFVDFSSPEKVSEEWEKLLRAIFDKPLFKKPPLGKPPSHIVEDGGVPSRSKGKLLALKDALVNDKASFRGLMGDFLDSFLESYEDFRIDFTKTDKPGDELIWENVANILPARDEFVEFVSLLANYRSESEVYERIADFFESALQYNWKPESMGAFNEMWFENFRFFTYELFLYYVAALLKNRRYNIANNFLSRSFLLPVNAHSSPANSTDYTVFYAGMQSMRYHNERLNLNRLDVVADLLKTRATFRQLPFAAISQADVVLFVASLLSETRRRSWYPRTLIYNSYGSTCELFARAASKKFFENLNILFGVANKEEFTTKLEAAFKLHRVDQWSQLNFHSDVSWNTLLNFEHLGTTT